MNEKLMPNLADTNRLLATATAEGAYALGVVTALSARDGRVASVELMERAVKCATVAEAMALYNSKIWKED